MQKPVFGSGWLRVAVIAFAAAVEYLKARLGTGLLLKNYKCHSNNHTSNRESDGLQGCADQRQDYGSRDGPAASEEAAEPHRPRCMCAAADPGGGRVLETGAAR